MQTLLAIGSLAAVMLFSLNMYRAMASTHLQLMLSETTAHVASVGEEVLAHVGQRDFDASTAAGVVEATGDLTAAGGFGGGCTYADCTTLEGFDGVATQIVRLVNRDTMRFDVALTVRYVDPTDPAQPSVTPTFAKEVAATIRHDLLPFDDGVVMRRVFTYLGD